MYIIQYITDYKQVPPFFLTIAPFFSGGGGISHLFFCFWNRHCMLDIPCKFVYIYPFTTQPCVLTVQKKLNFENIVGKGENAGNQHYLLFPQCFLSFLKQASDFEEHSICFLQMLSIGPV